MTNTSFNPIQIQQTASASTQPIALKQGQVFHGTIKQLYPDQIAEIQVGGNRFFAKLEVPLKAGDAHYFQVTNMNPQPELKVVTGQVQQGATTAQQLQQLMDTMNLPKSAEMQQVLRHFIREQLPISKEQLVTAEQWMKNLPDGVSKQDALGAMQRMAELKMPFTNEVFQALIYGQKTSGMTATLNSLAQLLENDTTLPLALRNTLMQQLQQLAKPFDMEIGGLLLAKSMQALTAEPGQVADKLHALNLLKGANLLPAQANLQNVLSLGLSSVLTGEATNTMQQAGQFIQAIANASPEQTPQLVDHLKSWLQNQNLLSSEQKQQLLQLVSRFEQLSPSQQTLEIFAKQMHEQLLKAFADQVPNQLFKQDANQLSAKEHLLSLIQPDKTAILHEQLLRNIVKIASDSPNISIQQQLLEMENELQAAINGKAMDQAIKTILRGLGISYEAALANPATETDALTQQLKPNLLQVLQEAQVSSPLKESAEALLARMNGMQLLSGENGHQQQLIMQVPLQFLGRKMDATLQWNGRMNKDGKLDSAYARILFYLQMESMQDTVIDMQVQNRIVTVTVFNEQAEQLKALSEPFSAALKVGLAEKEYHLSGVVLKSFEKSLEQKATKEPKNQPDQHSGVDIRV